jgi:hypothetical protein
MEGSETSGADETENGDSLEVPGDIYGVLFSLLDFRFMASLACTCRVAHAALRRLKRLKFAMVRLGPMQAFIRDEVHAMPDAAVGQCNVFITEAPMGFGKTITAYSIAFADPADTHHYVYVVPPKAFDTWVQEAAKIFGTVTNGVTPKTRVLFAHSNKKAHMDYIKKVTEAAGRGAHISFGPNVRALVTSSSSRYGMAVAKRWGTRFVMDEAHAVTDHTWQSLPPTRWLALFSANRIRVNGNGVTIRWGEVAVTARLMENTVPKVSLHFASVAPRVIPEFDESRNYTTPDQKIDSIVKNLDEYCRALTRIFATIPSGQVALYLPNGEAGDAISAELARLAPGWEIVPFTQATKKIRYFETLDRAILELRLDKSEAINILASHLIVVRPDWVNPIRYAQLIGRILRPTNENKEAAVYVIVPRGVPTYRISYFEALRNLMAKDLQLEIPLLRASELEKGEVTLQLLGSSLAKAAYAEVVAVLGTGFDKPNTATAVLQQWDALDDPKVKTLTRSQMVTLLGPTAIPAGQSRHVSPSDQITTSEELDDILGLSDP